MITSFDYIESEFQFLCGECMIIVKPNNLKRHLSAKHYIKIKGANSEYLNAMMHVYYHVVMPIDIFKESATYKEFKEGRKI